MTSAFARALRNHLRQRSWSVRAFAKRVGVDQSYLAKILRDERPPPLDEIAAWMVELEITGDEAQARFTLAAAELHAPALVQAYLTHLRAQVDDRKALIAAWRGSDGERRVATPAKPYRT